MTHGRKDYGAVRSQFADLRELPCHYCGGAGGSVDHKKPVAKGGTWARENLLPACHPCNHLKGDMDYEEFMAKRDSRKVCQGCNHYEMDHLFHLAPTGRCREAGCRCSRFS